NGSSSDLIGTVSASSSYNLIGAGSTGGLTNGVNGNQVGVADAMLNSLANNGGYTQTHSMMAGSPALDKGAAISGMTTDQRGQTRPYDISNIAAASGGNNSDIGAYEENPTCNTVTLSPTSLSNGTVGINYSQTITALGGTDPYTFAVTSGSLPGGLVLQSDGKLTGLPSASGTFNFTVTATYGFGCTGSRAYSLVIAACANIKTYTVNDTGDVSDVTLGDGVCATTGGVCTLRAAIQEINASPGCANNINFSVTGTINISSPYPDLAASFTFNGPGATSLTVRRNTIGTYRLLTIPLGAGATISGLTFSNGLNDEGGAIRNAGTLTVTDCAFSGNNSKGTNAGGPTGKTGGGGAIYNDGTATITRSAFTGNIATGGNGETFSANGGGGGGGGLGGALYNNGGTVTVTNTTISGNSAVGGAGGAGSTFCPSGPGGKGGGNGADATTAAGFGGGGFGGGNTGSGFPSVGGRFGGGGGGRANFSQTGANGGFLGGRGNDSSGCNSGGGGGGGAAGGAIFNNGGTFTIINATIVSNSAIGGAVGSNGSNGSAGSSRAGGIYNESGTLTIKNSILAGNTAQQAGFEDSDFNSNAITTNGYNLLGSGTGNPTGGSHDQTITPANVFVTALGPLQYFGSTTQVHLPLTGSPVIDKGASGTTVDQRNKTRPVDQPSVGGVTGGNNSDIGAFELQNCVGGISFSPSTLTTIPLNAAYSQTFTGSAGTAPYTFSLASGTLPTGLTLSSAGVLSGTATAAGSYTFSIQTYDQNDCTVTQSYTVSVFCAVITAQPLSQAVCPGASVTLSTTLDDATGATYQWRKGGSNIGGATGSSYTIASYVAATDAGSYDVVISLPNGCTTLTSNAATLSTLGLTTMTNAMPYWAGRLNGAQFDVGTVATSGANTWPATEPPGNAFDGTFAKSLIRNTTNAGYVFTPGSCDPAGRIINQMRIYTANDSVSRDPASYAIYGTTSTVSGNGPFALASFTLISSGSLALPAGRNTSSLSDTNSQLVSFANSTAYKSYMLVFPTNSGDGVSTQIGEVKFYPDNYQPTLSATAASITQGVSSNGTSIGTAVAGTTQAANTLTTAVSSDGTNFSSSATLNGVTISNVAVAANGNVTASLTATCAATSTSFTVRITNNQSQSVTATVSVNVTASTAPSFAGTATPSRQAGSPGSNSQIATVSDAETVGSLIVTVT
ncbi:MAG TPA: choice-of-anchor Q domain-containing protein, partial [Blastocatellia bacterium]|nr:choice-of-anchor Q domain-containing protein [Blastocatellia bacterium]